MGIVHRDVKPSNFLLDVEGHACLTDFGIALTAEDIRLTRTLEQMGTLAYMAPEQRTQRKVTEKADVYSLAVVLHELRTGELPGTLGAGISGPFGELVRWMGEPDPDERPTATEALRRLRSLEAETVAVNVAAKPLLPREPAPEPPPIPTREGEREEEEKKPPVPQLPLLEARVRLVRRAALGMLLLLFFVNYAETFVEAWLRDHYRLGIEWEQMLGNSARWFENELSFEPHDATNVVAQWGFSLVYFFLFPLLLLGTVVVFYRRRDPGPLLLLAVAATINYLLTLPFYLFFPVPERWTYPDSGAMLLSDLLTSKFIQAFRPFSGLNNCFPSVHVSMTVVLAACLYRAGSRFRRASVPLGLTIVLSTFVLGIHWISDILAGLACGLASFRLAERLLPRVERAIRSLPRHESRGLDRDPLPQGLHRG
jgi:serine/threonine protein kinase